MQFPLRIGAEGTAVSRRVDHVREQIEQVLFTNPGERVFRPEFGAGLRKLLFEPNAGSLWDITRKRLTAVLSRVLEGEVDPRTLQLEVSGEGEHLVVLISYRLAGIDHTEQHHIPMSQ
jgi:hypothetical protein